MALLDGTRIGPYEILSALGAGGMGEVYRARDTKLGRDVALKVIPDTFALDPDRLARFQREAQVLASLNHPHIAAIYGFEDSGDTHALVLELVEGETLADRIARGPIPLDEALPIGRQIAEALEAAHEQGIIHRDLKPANIKITPDGVVKVLDFGLAKLADPAHAPASDLSLSPTITSPAMMTGVGMLMGTAAYMSPEQAKGRPADKRSDMWAFGCVLYEMLTGTRPFEGDDVSDTLAAILRGEPDWSALPVRVPGSIRAVIRRCLEKDRRKRVADIAAALFALDEHASLGGFATVLPRRPLWRRVVTPLAAALVTSTVVGDGIWFIMRTPATAPEMRVEITTPETTDPSSFAISPDGRRLVFVASADGQSRLWLRPLDGVSAQPLAGTDGAGYPFWSPDSRSVGFFAGSKLERIDIGGGPPQALADSAPRGGTWNPGGIILFAQSTAGPLLRVLASGGEAVAATKLEAGQTGHRFPRFLPGGRQFLFYAVGTSDVQGIYLGSLDSPETTRLAVADAVGVYVPPDWLLFVRRGTLVAQRLDLARGELTGDLVTVADPVSVDGGTNIAALSVSAAGLIAYRSGGTSGRQLTWFDRSGKALGMLGAIDDNALSYPRLSPDGRRVAVYRVVQGNVDIWLLDAVRATRFTFDPSLDRFAIWSPDGSRIVFDSIRKGHRDLYLKPSNGAGSEEVLVESPQDKSPYDWSADGRFLLYGVTNDPKTGYDLWVLPVGGDRKPFVWLNASFSERQSVFSPDGRWVAYASNESGRFEIYVRPFQGASATAPRTASGQWQVSTTGGIWARWRPDGKELYYIAPDGKMMAAPIEVSGTTLNAGAPVALFQTRIVGGGTNIDLGRQYDVASDGRFLINTVLDDVPSPITLLQNWNPPAK